MRKNKIFALFLIITCLWACRSYEYESMPTPVKINPIVSSTISSNCPGDCILIDTILIINNDCATEWFSFYDARSLEHITDFGKKGHLPGELLLPLFFKNTGQGLDRISFYDLHRHTVYNIGLNELLSGNGYAVLMKNEKKLPEDLIGSTDLSFAGENILVGNTISSEEVNRMSFMLYDTERDSKKEVHFEPRYSFDNYGNLVMAYSNSLYGNKDKGVVAIAFKHFDMVNFYDNGGRLIRSVRFAKPVKPQESGNVLYNSLCYGTRDFLYVRRPEVTMDQLREGKVDGIKILKFDWEGNLHGAYITSMNLGIFCVDEKNELLYSVIPSDDPEYSEITVFDLKV